MTQWQKIKWGILNFFLVYPREQVVWAYPRLTRLMYQRPRSARLSLWGVESLGVLVTTVSQPKFKVPSTGDHFHFVRQGKDFMFYEADGEPGQVMGYHIEDAPLFYRLLVCETAKLDLPMSEIGDE